VGSAPGQSGHTRGLRQNGGPNLVPQGCHGPCGPRNAMPAASRAAQVGAGGGGERRKLSGKGDIQYKGIQYSEGCDSV